MMTNKIKQILQHKFLNIDGTINKTVLVSAITLIIVLVDQVLAMFNIVPAHQDQAVAILNTILTILSIFVFVEGPTTASIRKKYPSHGKLLLFQRLFCLLKIGRWQRRWQHRLRPL